MASRQGIQNSYETDKLQGMGVYWMIGAAVFIAIALAYTFTRGPTVESMGVGTDSEMSQPVQETTPPTTAPNP